MLKAVAFDLDSTLVDFLRYKRLAAQSAALAMVDAGLDMEPSLAEERLWETYRENGLDGDVAFERFLQSTVGRVEPRILNAGIEAYQRTKQALLQPYPRTVATLQALARRGLRFAVVTDASRDKALQRLAALRLLPYFECVVTRDDTLRGKDDEHPYLQLVARLGVRAKEVLMVGDHPQRDVRTAKRAGLRTALAEYGAQANFATAFPFDEPDFRLRRIDDLVGIVDRLCAAEAAEAGEPEQPPATGPEA